MFGFFDIYYVLIVTSSLFTVYSVNPITSIISLIIVYFFVSFLFLGYNIDFLALTLLLVYVGAISVLFLFVIMLLNLNQLELDYRLVFFFFVSQTIMYGLFFELLSMYLNTALYRFWGDVSLSFFISYGNFLTDYTDLALVGYVLYTYFFVAFLLSSFLLLLAMIGSITLTLRHSDFVRRQQVWDQVSRTSFLRYFPSSYAGLL